MTRERVVCLHVLSEQVLRLWAFFTAALQTLLVVKRTICQEPMLRKTALPMRRVITRLSYALTAIIDRSYTRRAVQFVCPFKVGGGPDESDASIIFYHRVRITSMKTFHHGLVIADFDHMPFGCSVWPSFCSVGPNWSYNGEIDDVEGVNNKQMLVNSYFFPFRRRFMSGFRNQNTFHTGKNQECNIPNQAPIVNSGPAFTGTVMTRNRDCSNSSSSCVS